MENPNSILESTKKQLGILSDYDAFDAEIIIAINSAFFTLHQLGAGPDDPFTISDTTSTWDEFVTEGSLDLVKSYVFLRAKLLFDPPTNSFLVDSINKQLEMFEYRIRVQSEKDLLYPADLTDIYITEEDT